MPEPTTPTAGDEPGQAGGAPAAGGRETAAGAAEPRPSRPRFSQELEALAARFDGQPVCLGDFIEATRGRGYDLLLVLIALPFLTPIPLPGFSIAFGLIVALIGGRLALGQRPWLPARLLRRPLPPQFLNKVLRAARRVVRLLEWFLRPRLTFLHEHFLYRRLTGALILVSGLYLVLPLPIPFSNGLPAWAVLLLAAAALERDGLCFIAGCLMFGVATAFFLFLALGGARAVQWLWPWP